MRAYIINLNKAIETRGDLWETLCSYDDTCEFGKWIDLPNDEVGKEIYEKLGCAEEFVISRIDSPIDFDFDELSIIELNEYAEALEDYGEICDEEEVIIEYLLDDGLELPEALHRCSNYHVVYDVGDTEELGKSIADELCMEFYDFEDYIMWDDFVEDHVSGEYMFFNGNCIVEN